MTTGDRRSAPGSMLSYAWDLPNRYSIVGLVCAVAGIYFAILGVFAAAMIGLVWAVAFDWLDGHVARGIPGRSAEQREFGAQLDSLIDIVSFGVAPAVLLLAVGEFGVLYLPGAAAVVAVAAIRLSYFNVFGLAGGSNYRGLALDNNMIVLVALFAFQSLLSPVMFAVILYATLMGLGILNLSSIKTPKPGGRWIIGVLAYAVVMSAVFGWQLIAVV